MNINHTEAGESSVLGDLEARLAEAHSAVEAGNRALAERLYREMVAAGVRDVRAYCNLGVLALLEKHSDEAVGWLEQAVALDPDHARSHLNLGMPCSLSSTPPKLSRYCRGRWSLILSREKPGTTWASCWPRTTSPRRRWWPITAPLIYNPAMPLRPRI